MENNENKKTPEELADEALDQVAGGEYNSYYIGTCPVCREDKRLEVYYDPANPLATVHHICADCARDLGYVRA